MPKDRSKPLFFCPQCGYESHQWMGFCPSCRNPEPLVEALARPAATASPGRWLGATSSELQELAQVSAHADERLTTGLKELDRVLGGGLVPGSLTLMAGEPGIGKSTLLLQVAQLMGQQAPPVVYVSGEESAQQVKLRGERLGLPGRGLFFLAETDVDAALQRLEEVKPRLAIVDSVQTLYTQEAPGGAGSVSQVRECARRLMLWCKARSVPVLLAGHVTKDGTLAGPRVLEHMVDVVLYMEGERLSSYRILKGVKNRFGSTDEIGVFQMGSTGMEEVPDPSRMLLAERQESAVGSAVLPVMEGNRPILVEVQALTAPSFLPAPRRIANGVDLNRLLMLAAVLSQRAGLALGSQDIIVNVVGGLKVSEPAADLAVALAIGSSLRNVPLDSRLVALGEVGLSGELRSVPQVERRLAEAARLGYRRCVVPPSVARSLQHIPEMQVETASTVAQALSKALPRGREAPAARSSARASQGLSG